MNLKVIAITIIFFLLAGLLTFSQHSRFLVEHDPIQPCEQPLTYRIEDIDSRFDINTGELKEIMKQVEDLWFKALDKDLLDYDKNGRVAINLVYSDDQKRTEEERAYSQRIKVKTDQIDMVKRGYLRSRKHYEKQKNAFQAALDNFNQEVERYNDFAKNWSKNELSTDERKRLERMELTINRLDIKVDRQQQNLEMLRRQTNAKSRQLNQLVDEQNEMVSEYNSRFSSTKKFDQGRYVRKGNNERINIFQFSNYAQLKTVLAHETGHAFGLDHVDNPESVMHEMMGAQNIFNLQLTQEDITSINNLCSN